jgi:hypothetical protein
VLRSVRRWRVQGRATLCWWRARATRTIRSATANARGFRMRPSRWTRRKRRGERHPDGHRNGCARRGRPNARREVASLAWRPTRTCPGRPFVALKETVRRPRFRRSCSGRGARLRSSP